MTQSPVSLRAFSRIIFLLTLSALLIPACVHAQLGANLLTTIPSITSPYAIGVNPVTNKIYVACQSGGGLVYVIDGATNTVKTQIAVGSVPYAVAVNPLTNKVYVANETGNSVSVIDGSSDTVTTTVQLGTGASPFAVVVNTSTNVVYAINNGNDTVTVINGNDNTIIGTPLPLGANTNPVAAAVNPVTNTIYVANNGDPNSPSGKPGNVTLIAGATVNGSITPASIITTVGTGACGSGNTCQNPRAIAINPITNKVYVVYISSNDVSVLNGSTGAFIKRVTVGNSPREVQLNTVSNMIYVANEGSPPAKATVSVISGATDTVTGSPQVGVFPRAIVVNSATNQIYVGNQTGGTITAIDGASLNTSTVIVGSTVFAIGFNPVTNLVYVANNGGNSVSVVNGDTNVVTSVPVGSNPVAAVVDPVDNQVYVVNQGANSVSVIDAPTNTVTPVNVGAGPVAIDINPVTDVAYVANETDGTVTAITETFTTSNITVGGSPVSVAVNPATNHVYVGKAGGNVTDIDVSAGTTFDILATGTVNNVVVNPATNTIYASLQQNAVTVVNGNIPSASVQVGVGNNPGPMAVDQKTGMVYVANRGSANVSVLNGASLVTTVSLSSNPTAIGLNAATNKVYVGLFSGSVAVIDGSTNTVKTTISGTGIGTGVAVDPLSNRIYVSTVTGITVIDGSTDTLSTTIASAGATALVINPALDKVFGINSPAGTVTALNVDSHVRFPITTAIQGVHDSMTISNPGDPVFVTSNLAPTFTITVTSAYTSSPAYVSYSGPPTPVNPSPSEAYAVTDGGPLTAVGNPTPGTNPTTFTITMPNQSLGLHTLYVYSAYGNEGGHSSNGNALGNSPEMSTPTALNLIIVAVPSTTTVSSSNDTQEQGQNVTFTANLAIIKQNPGAPDATGTISFYDGMSSTPFATVSISGSGTAYTATTTTNSLTVGTHTIRAVYSGDTNYPSSTGSTVQSIVNAVPAHIIVAGGGTQTTVYGQPFANPLAVSVTDSTNAPVDGVSITYSVTSPLGSPGMTFIPQPIGTTVSGSAQVTANPLAVGSFTVTASLPSGITPTPTPQAVNFTLNVTPAPLTITANDASRPYGQPNPQFSSTGSGLVNGDSASGVITGFAAFSTTATLTSAPGSYIITPTQGSLAAANYTFSFQPGHLTIVKATPGLDGTLAVTVSSSLNPSTYGSPVIFTATLPADATGTITFLDGATSIGTAAISGGQASLPATSTLVVGTHQITASYGGDGNYNPAVSAALAQMVTQAMITVSATAVTRPYGQPNPSFTPTYSGFVNGDTQAVISGVPVLSTTATLTSPPGPYPIAIGISALTATNYGFAALPGTLTVIKATPGQNGTVAVTVASSLNPSIYGNAVTFTATVPADATGTVTFLDGTTVLGTGTISSGIATLTTSVLVAGTHPITAQYNGDSNYNGATASLAQVVNRAPATVDVVVPTGPPTPAGQGVPITSDVPQGETGTITFYDGTTPIGTGTIVNGVVTIDVDTLSPGTHTITAVYSGDANYLPATSPPKTVIIAALTADFAIKNNTSPQLIPPGASATYNITITSVNGIFTNVVTLTATNLPPNATYTYTPPTVTPGSAGATSNFTVSVPAQSAALHRSSRTPLILAVLLLPFAVFRRARGKPHRLLLWLLVTLTVFGSAIGCGVGGYFSLPQQTYVITVTGTSGTLVHSTTATLTVE